MKAFSQRRPIYFCIGFKRLQESNMFFCWTGFHWTSLHESSMLVRLQKLSGKNALIENSPSFAPWCGCRVSRLTKIYSHETRHFLKQHFLLFLRLRADMMPSEWSVLRWNDALVWQVIVDAKRNEICRLHSRKKSTCQQNNRHSWLEKWLPGDGNLLAVRQGSSKT